METIKNILLQLPIDTRLVIRSAPIPSFCEIGVVRDDYAVWATANDNIEDENFAHLVTNLILDFNRKSPLHYK